MTHEQSRLDKLLEYLREGILGIMATSALLMIVNLGLIGALGLPEQIKPWVIIATSIAFAFSIFTGALTMTGMINYFGSDEQKGGHWLTQAKVCSNLAVWALFVGVIFMLIQLIMRLEVWS